MIPISWDTDFNHNMYLTNNSFDGFRSLKEDYPPQSIYNCGDYQ